MMALRSYDFRLKRLGRDVLLRPLTSEAYLWLSDYLPPGERRLPASQAHIPEERVTKTLTTLLRAGLTIAPLDIEE